MRRLPGNAAAGGGTSTDVQGLASTATALSLVAATAAIVTLLPNAAAAECGTFVGDEGDNVIFYGRKAQTYSSYGTCVGTYPSYEFGRQQAVVCWRDKDGLWQLEEVTGCTSSTSQEMLILGAGGDDIVMPVVHYAHNEEFVCPVEGTSGWLVADGSTPASPAVSEWYARYSAFSPRGSECAWPAGCSALPFDVSIEGGRGEDELHGAPGDDYLLSSNEYGDPWCTPHGGRGSGDSALDECVCAYDPTCCDSDWDGYCISIASYCGADCSGLEASPSDQSRDLLCGHGGNDVLVGDEDPDPDGFELLAGGPGWGDYCQGVGIPQTIPAPQCCDTSTVPGCSDPVIEALVCAADPFCCDVRWDSLCVGQVTTVAGASCHPEGLVCCEESPDPGCADPDIEAAVCEVDSYCCTTRWDSICVGEVETVFGGSCDELTDIATPECEGVDGATSTATGFGAVAQTACGDDTVESLPPMPPSVAAEVLTTYRVSSDGYAPGCG